MGPCTWHIVDHLASDEGEKRRGRGEGEERGRSGGGKRGGRGKRERNRREEKGDGLQLFTHSSLHIYHTKGGMGGHTHHVTEGVPYPDIQLVLEHSLVIENTDHLHPEW